MISVSSYGKRRRRFSLSMWTSQHLTDFFLFQIVSFLSGELEKIKQIKEASDETQSWYISMYLFTQSYTFQLSFDLFFLYEAMQKSTMVFGEYVNAI